MDEFKFTNKYFNDIDEDYDKREKVYSTMSFVCLLSFVIGLIIMIGFEDIAVLGGFLFISGILGLLVCFVGIIPASPKLINYESYFEQLDINDLKKIDEELNRDDVIYLKSIAMFLTDSYIIQIGQETNWGTGRGNFSHVIKYDDIVWMSFSQERDPDLAFSYTYVELCTKDKYYTDFEADKVYFRFTDDIAKIIKDKVLSKNPNIMIGRTPEIVSKIKSTYNIDL